MQEFKLALEWRLIAWWLTYWYFVLVGKDFIESLYQSAGLQALLFITMVLWFQTKK